jgi:hypothetical protein
VLIDPNQFKRIDIPVVSVGEVNGMLYMNKDNTLKGIGRILVKFYNRNGTKPIAEALSESDGYISYLGFEPGEYIARIDSVQLNNLDFKSDPQQFEFTIKSSEEGDIEEGLDFILSDKKIKEIPIDTLLQNSVRKEVKLIDMVRDSISSLMFELPISQNDENILEWGNICTQIGNYCVQCGAFRYKRNAMRFALYINQNAGMTVGIVLHNGLYKVRVGCVSEKRNAVEIKNRLIEKIVCDDMFVLIRK